jgi:hypothetical protein
MKYREKDDLDRLQTSEVVNLNVYKKVKLAKVKSGKTSKYKTEINPEIQLMIDLSKSVDLAIIKAATSGLSPMLMCGVLAERLNKIIIAAGKSGMIETFLKLVNKNIAKD